MLSDYEDWDESTVAKIWEVCDKLGKEKYGLDYYQPRFDLVNYQGMIDVEASIGMPIFYKHSSFGKEVMQLEQDYKGGRSGLAYELVINSNPCLAYLMDSNSITTTILVIAHANCGHAHFFKNNYMFKQNTDPSDILGKLAELRDSVDKLEEIDGLGASEALMSCLHLLQQYAVNFNETVKRPKNTATEDDIRDRINRAFDKSLPGGKNRKAIAFSEVEAFLRSIFPEDGAPTETVLEGEENLFTVIEQYGELDSLELKIIRLFKEIQQYFYPQGQTKIMNEGFACYIHYKMMFDLYQMKEISEGSYIEFLQLHCGVLNSRDYGPINPYKVGFEVLMELDRACKDQTEEDIRFYGKELLDKGGVEAVKWVVKYYKDESFIRQFLSDKVITKMGLMAVTVRPKTIDVNGTAMEDGDLVRKLYSDSIARDVYYPPVTFAGYDKNNNALHFTVMRNYANQKRAVGSFDLASTIRVLTGCKVILVDEDGDEVNED